MTLNDQGNLWLKNTASIGIDNALLVGYSGPLQVYHTGADGDDGVMIIRYDETTADGDLLGGIGFDSIDGNSPSSILEASCYIAAYASEDHGVSDKGGEMMMGVTNIDGDDDTTSVPFLKINDKGVAVSNGKGSGVNQDHYTAFTVHHDYDTVFESQLDDNQGGGEILTYGAAQEGSIGQLHYLHTDNSWNSAVATGVVHGASQLLGIATTDGIGRRRFLLDGYFKVASGNIEGTPAAGAPVYVSDVAGKFDFAAPADNNEFVRIVGYCIDVDSSDILLRFKPDNTWVELDV